MRGISLKWIWCFTKNWHSTIQHTNLNLLSELVYCMVYGIPIPLIEFNLVLGMKETQHQHGAILCPEWSIGIWTTSWYIHPGISHPTQHSNHCWSIQLCQSCQNIWSTEQDSTLPSSERKRSAPNAAFLYKTTYDWPLFVIFPDNKTKIFFFFTLPQGFPTSGSAPRRKSDQILLFLILMQFYADDFLACNRDQSACNSLWKWPNVQVEYLLEHRLLLNVNAPSWRHSHTKPCCSSHNCLGALPVTSVVLTSEDASLRESPVDVFCHAFENWSNWIPFSGENSSTLCGGRTLGSASNGFLHSKGQWHGLRHNR